MSFLSEGQAAVERMVAAATTLVTTSVACIASEYTLDIYCSVLNFVVIMNDVRELSCKFEEPMHDVCNVPTVFLTCSRLLLCTSQQRLSFALPDSEVTSSSFCLPSA